ncbi:HAD family hydrolase [Faecalicatena contorta]|uniref:16S rRNA pseudouridine516 synthase n=1 Tax=Faecalicatena contorta TaxID=39482 RepID=A0A316A532_9FIRM|nr:HAD family phosphatase [Faecalicatena contorta]PWJ52298.1 16S rRNA pseudouridine516 synthase [Faecalicatena contorta]SUQ12576.1 16S rRNA pseudouridine516 synthase [Faecalicatena contorta]
MLENKKAVIFDLDGSLVDSMWIWPEVDIQYMKKYDLRAPMNFHKAVEGMSYTETAQYFLDTFPSLRCTLDDVRREWMEMTIDLYQTKVSLKRGAREFLERMRSMGVLMGIATSNARELVDATLKSLHIQDYFASVRTSCEVSAGKPAPDVYLKVAEDLRVSPGSCLVFEDVPRGIEAGKNAGMTVCAVEDEFSKPDEREKRQLADYFIRDYYDIENRTYEICGV